MEPRVSVQELFMAIISHELHADEGHRGSSLSFRCSIY